MLIDNFQQAKSNPEKEYHLASRLDRTLSLIRDDPDAAKDRVDDAVVEAEEAGIDHCIFTVIESLGEWYYQIETIPDSADRDFDLVLTGLDALDQLFVEARVDGWENVALVAAIHRLREFQRLSGWESEITDELVRVKELLVDDGALISSNRNFATKLLDLVIELSSPDKKDILLDVYVACGDWAASFREDGDLQSERDVLRRAIRLRERLGGTADQEKTRLIESIEAEVSRSEYHFRNAGILRSGLAECREYLPEEKRNEWLRQLRIENRAGRSGMTAKPTGVTPTQLQLESERLVVFYRQLRNQYPREESFLRFLRSDELLIDYQDSVSEDLERLNADPLRVLLHESFENKRGDIVAQNPGLGEVLDWFGGENQSASLDEELMEEWTPRSYQTNVKRMNAVLSRVLRRLIAHGELLEIDFYRVFDRVEYLDPHREAYLTDTVIAFFDEDYPKALHVGMPQFEAVLADLLEIKGERVNKDRPEGTTGPYPLGRLFTIIEENVDENLGSYLAYQYTDPGGMNLRNAIAHGEYPYPGDSFDYASILLFDIARTLMRIESHYD